MVLVILFAGLGAIACDNDPKPGKEPGKPGPGEEEPSEPLPCSFNGTPHLGIDEAGAGKTHCVDRINCGGLVDYNTSTGTINTKFPAPIYRVGLINNFGASPYNLLTDTVNYILTTYATDGRVAISAKEGLTNDKRIKEVQIFNNPNWGDGGVFWEEKILGLQARLDKDKDSYVYAYLSQIGNNEGMGLITVPKIPALVQLQPTNAVRVAPYYARKACFLNQLARRGAQRSQQDEYSVRALARTVRPEDETRTEQPVVAEGGDKEPKLNTVAQRFERMNRSAIARNNRNIKSMV